jgi:hypothetical protein
MKIINLEYKNVRDWSAPEENFDSIIKHSFQQAFGELFNRPKN